MQNGSPKASGNKNKKQKQNLRQIVDYMHETQTLGITAFVCVCVCLHTGVMILQFQSDLDSYLLG